MRALIVASAALLLMAGSGHAQNPPERVATATGGNARASKLIGSKVYAGDTSIGQIEDILFDLDRATVSGVILSVGGFLGIGDKRVEVPPNQVKVGSEAKFTTDMTREQLLNAPAFDASKLRQP